jgi:hypothetical protein
MVFLLDVSASMIVDDFDLRWAVIGPNEADPVLVVDPDAPLALTISSEGLQPVSGRDPELFEITSRVELIQLAASDLPVARW